MVPLFPPSVSNNSSFFKNLPHRQERSFSSACQFFVQFFPSIPLKSLPSSIHWRFSNSILFVQACLTFDIFISITIHCRIYNDNKYYLFPDSSLHTAASVAGKRSFPHLSWLTSYAKALWPINKTFLIIPSHHLCVHTLQFAATNNMKFKNNV